jgi:hypothetical protein
LTPTGVVFSFLFLVFSQTWRGQMTWNLDCSCYADLKSHVAKQQRGLGKIIRAGKTWSQSRLSFQNLAANGERTHKNAPQTQKHGEM